MFFHKLFLLSLISLAVLLTAPQLVQATNPEDPLGLSYGQYTGLTDDDVRLTVAQIIRVALGVLGTVALVLIVYAGFTWMTAAGNEDQVTKARQIIFASVIGLVIILSAYAITNFVVRGAYQATTNQPYGTLEVLP